MRQVPAPNKPDPRDVPAYGIAEAAQYLDIPVATLRSWVAGRPYPISGGEKFFQPIIDIADKKSRRLSFINLVEAHILDAIRRGENKIELPKIRQAIAYLKREFGSKHPLADQQLETDGLDLFVQKYGRLINISREGQLAMREMLQAFLRRIQRDSRGIPIRLYLFTRRGDADEPRNVVADPAISFGRPTLVGTNIPTSILAERFKAGDSPEELAEDYERPKEEIWEAIRYELKAAA